MDMNSWTWTLERCWILWAEYLWELQCAVLHRKINIWDMGPGSFIHLALVFYLPNLPWLCSWQVFLDQELLYIYNSGTWRALFGRACLQFCRETVFKAYGSEILLYTYIGKEVICEWCLWDPELVDFQTIQRAWLDAFTEDVAVPD